jgi:hypothetical protein
MTGLVSAGRLPRSIVAAAFAGVTIVASSSVARAQEALPPNQAAAIEMRKQFLADLDTLNSKFTALAQAIPADKYSWRPGPGVRSIGEAFMHSASEFYTYAPAAFGAPRSPLIERGEAGYKKFESMSTKEDVLKHLKEGLAYAKQSINAVDPNKLVGKQPLFGGQYNVFETSLGVTDDLHEHLGQLIAYARMNGIKPPWSK